MRFMSAIDESGDRLRAMLGELVTMAVESRRATPAEPADRAIDGDDTVRGVDAGYICYRLEDGVWTRRHSFLPEQPPSAHETFRSSATSLPLRQP